MESLATTQLTDSQERKIIMSTLETALEKAIEVEVDPRLSRGVKAFLRVLNSSGGPPLLTDFPTT